MYMILLIYYEQEDKKKGMYYSIISGGKQETWIVRMTWKLLHNLSFPENNGFSNQRAWVSIV